MKATDSEEKKRDFMREIIARNEKEIERHQNTIGAIKRTWGIK
jgi:hypothetical protein